jgi:hypothetical protein
MSEIDKQIDNLIVQINNYQLKLLSFIENSKINSKLPKYTLIHVSKYNSVQDKIILTQFKIIADNLKRYLSTFRNQIYNT